MGERSEKRGEEGALSAASSRMSGRKEEPLVWESMAERTERMMRNKKSVQGPLYMITRDSDRS